MPTNSFLTFVEDALTRFNRIRLDLRTRRIVSALPEHLRKDIGWPEPAARRRYGPGIWGQ